MKIALRSIFISFAAIINGLGGFSLLRFSEASIYVTVDERREFGSLGTKFVAIDRPINPMTVSRKTAKKLLYDFMFESDRAQDWVEDVWSLSPFLGQGAANAAEVLGALIETCSERQLNAVVASLYAAHTEAISELKSAPEWRVQIDPNQSQNLLEDP